MFNCRDLEEFVCSSTEALELKFGTAQRQLQARLRLRVHVRSISCTSLSLYFQLLPLHARSHSTAVRAESDIEDPSLAFAPQFTHQVFGEK